MSDIQRYDMVVSFDFVEEIEKDCGYWVKYDDHIAEVRDKDKWFNDELDFLRGENMKLQTRIEELEFILSSKQYCMLDVTKKQIKAEGIREMLVYCMVTKPETDEYGVPVIVIDIDDIEYYADKLEKGDE